MILKCALPRDFARFGFAGFIVVLGMLFLWLSQMDQAGALACFRRFALSIEGMRAGRFWQVLTYSLLHASWFHFLCNVAMLAALAYRVQRIFGSRALWGTYLLGVLSGGLMHLGVSALSDARWLVGASGGAMALLFLVIGVSPESRMFPFWLRAKNLGRGLLLGSLILLLIRPELGIPGLSSLGEWWTAQLGHAAFGVSHACHLGGALAGILIAARVLRPRVTLEVLRAERQRREGEGH